MDPEKHAALSGAKEGVFHMPLLVIDPNAEDRTIAFQIQVSRLPSWCSFAGGIFI